MSFNANEVPQTGGINIEPMDVGTYPARIVGIALLGLHEQTYLGEVKEPKDMMYMFYEFLDEFLPDEEGEPNEEKPRWLSERFPFNNLASQKAKSTIRYLALDPLNEYGGDFSQLLDTPCMVTVVQNAGTGKNKGKIFNNISGVSSMRPREAAKAPSLVNPPFLFDFETPTPESWNILPAWVQKVATEALNYPGSAVEELVTELGEEKALEEKPKKRVDRKNFKKEEADSLESSLNDEIVW